MIGPEQGYTQPRHDDHLWRLATPRRTARFGALAFGIGTSEVEHVLATQTPAAQARPADAAMRLSRRSSARGVTAKDLILGD